MNRDEMLREIARLKGEITARREAEEARDAAKVRAQANSDRLALVAKVVQARTEQTVMLKKAVEKLGGARVTGHFVYPLGHNLPPKGIVLNQSVKESCPGVRPTPPMSAAEAGRLARMRLTLAEMDSGACDRDVEATATAPVGSLGQGFRRELRAKLEAISKGTA